MNCLDIVKPVNGLPRNLMKPLAGNAGFTINPMNGKGYQLPGVSGNSLIGLTER